MNHTTAHGRIRFGTVYVSLLLAGLIACSGPKPILYPNEHYKAVGKAEADEDIAQCRRLAEDAGARPSKGKGREVAESTVGGGVVGAAGGAAGGAVVGSPGTGAAVGAASGVAMGLFGGLLGGSGKPSQAHMSYVNKCLEERGYEPVGWE
jgi:hypothetical protein